MASDISPDHGSNKTPLAHSTPGGSVPATEKILQPEFVALSACLKDAVVKTGQIYGFYADTHKLNIESHVPNAPRSLTTALGRDIQKYDQLCDSIEAHLLRAISVLKRDLRREEERIAAEQRRKNAELLMLPPALPPSLENASEVPPSHAPSEGSSTNPRNSPVVNTLVGRRPSAISISSLHRPQFPLKLDLSSSSLRITEEEAALYQKGLASPVTLAPKSARPVDPNEFSAELLAAFASVPLDAQQGPAEIDLTLPHDTQLSHDKSGLDALGVGLGDSSDKPIELDLEAMDIEMANMANAFNTSAGTGQSSNTHNSLFSPLLSNGGEKVKNLKNTEEDNEFHLTIDTVSTHELFGDFSPNEDLKIDLSSSEPSMLQLQPEPSPEALLAQFSDAENILNAKSSPFGNKPSHEAGENFAAYSLDDLSNIGPGFFSNSQGLAFGMDMDAFLQSRSVTNMDSVDHKVEGDKS